MDLKIFDVGKLISIEKVVIGGSGGGDEGGGGGGSGRGSPMPQSRSFRKNCEKSEQASQFYSKINSLSCFSAKSQIYGDYLAPPILRSGKGLADLVGSNCQPWRELIERAAKPEPPLSINENQALVYGDLNLNQSRPTWTYAVARYSLAREMRRYYDEHKEGIVGVAFPPQIFTAGVLLASRERQSLILHQRSDRVETYKNGLHIFGGAFRASEDQGSGIDHKPDVDAHDTARREVAEEANFRGPFKVPRVLLSKELDTGYLQCVALGFGVPEGAVDEMLEYKDFEGVAVEVKLSELEARLIDDDTWVPTGRAITMAWLALGAPITTLERSLLGNAQLVTRKAFRSDSRAQGVLQRVISKLDRPS